jgi:hypothetical protein
MAEEATTYNALSGRPLNQVAVGEDVTLLFTTAETPVSVTLRWESMTELFHKLQRLRQRAEAAAQAAQ